MAPRLADGIELVGQYKDSGLKSPPYIVRRADGQTISLPEILYRIAEVTDGGRDHAQIADQVTERVGRRLEADDVRFLVEAKLRPLGVVADADGSSPPLAKADPLLALRFRAKVVPARAVRAVTTVLQPLFAPPVVLAVLAAFVAVEAWLLGVHGLAPAVRAVVYQPSALLVVFGTVVLATAFHELGHATACRVGGGEPGVIGVGIYIVWPAFYTDVTDAYRLDRRGRLRTDLGGVYFNAIVALAAVAVFFATRFEPLLLVAFVQSTVITQQLLPLLRLDGYYVLTDLTGVPDLLARMKPILLSLVPGRRPEPRVTELKPWVRWVVTGYVAALVPILGLLLVAMLMSAPRVVATAWDTFAIRLEAASRALESGQEARGIVALLQTAAVTLPAVGTVYSTGRLGRRAGNVLWSWAGASPIRRAGAPVLAACLVVLLWPSGAHRPIEPGERGALAGTPALGSVPRGQMALVSDHPATRNGLTRADGRGATDDLSRRNDRRELTAVVAPRPSSGGARPHGVGDAVAPAPRRDAAQGRAAGGRTPAVAAPDRAATPPATSPSRPTTTSPAAAGDQAPADSESPASSSPDSARPSPRRAAPAPDGAAPPASSSPDSATPSPQPAAPAPDGAASPSPDSSAPSPDAAAPSPDAAAPAPDAAAPEAAASAPDAPAAGASPAPLSP